jgi:hypothetical protein
VRRGVVHGGIGLAVSVLFGWLALRAVPLDDLGKALVEADYRWLVPAGVALAVALWLRAMRWRALFVGDDRRLVTPAVAFWTVVIGLCFNSLLPARAGELARAVALNHETGIPRTQALVGIVVERVLDVATLAVLLLAALVLLPSDDLVDDLATASAVLLVVIVAAAVLAARLRRRLRAPAARLLRRVPVFGGVRTERTLQSVARGSGAVLKPRVAGPALAWTLASWLALAVSNWCCMQAFSRDWPWHAALFVLIVTNLAMVVPATAGSIGVFEAATRLALAAYGVGASAALSYAIVLHALNLVPYILLGAVALGRLGLRARDLSPASEETAYAPGAR